MKIKLEGLDLLKVWRLKLDIWLCIGIKLNKLQTTKTKIVFPFILLKVYIMTKFIIWKVNKF